MRARPWHGPLGLRGRIVGVVLVTTVVSLAVAAVGLLGPLQQELRNSAKQTLQKDLRGATSGFKRLDLAAAPDYVLPAGSLKSVAERVRAAILYQQRALSARVGASRVTLLGYHDLSGHGYAVAPTPDSDEDTDPYDDAAGAFLNGKQRYSFGSINGTEYVRAALPFLKDGDRYVLAVRKPIDTIRSAVHVVATAFLTAALAALALTLLLGIPLAARLVRRLRRLRQAAVTLAEGGPSVEVPVDRARDEVGDLARTFSTMQRRLHQQEQARRAFVATASHELRTPLASLDGMLELMDDDLRSGEPDIDDALSLLERARAQSRRLGRLAADLLDLSRLDAEVELRSEPVELSELSRAVLAEFELGTEERGITLLLDDGPGSVWALGDPGSVARIVRILLDNAVRVSSDGGEIDVALRNGSQATVSVRDDGPGVPAEERELIFERFKRGRGTAGKAGFGLGLAIGRELAERMGGELVLEDAAVPGATFTLRLPATGAPKEEPVAVL
jgi:signal transduction histidine kinase